jgi:PAS domain S-box-containing protein
MSWQLTVYATTCFVSAAIMLLLALYAWRHREAQGATAFTVMMALVIYWSILAGVEGLLPLTRQQVVVRHLKYVSLAGVPVALLIFGLQYTGSRAWVTTRRVALLSLIPLITQVMIWTNPYHGLWVTLETGLPSLWFWLHSAYSFVLVFIALVLMAASILRASSVRRWQAGLLLVGISLPLVFNILHTFRLIPYVVELTPIGFVFTGLAFAWTMYRQRLFDLTPLAREALVEGMQNGVLVIDLQERIVDHNAAVERILGVARPGGRRIGDVLPVWPDVRARLRADRAAEMDVQLEQADGLRHYEIHITPLRDRQRTLAGYLLTLHDVTERRRHAQELEARNAELDAFAHTVAHDLKTPLSVLIGFGTLLEARAGQLSPEQLRAKLDAIVRNGYKMTNIIDELLLLASVRKMDSVDLVPLEMGAVVAEARQRLVDLVAEHEAQIHVPERWPAARGYAPWVEEVWTNYLSNAVKYGGRPPAITLGASPDGEGYVRFWVQDNGPGLEPEAQAQLFAEFTRLHQVRAEGHGLGLSIVQRIVKKLGGDVGVTSEPGAGSTFWFTLPSA